MEVRKYDLRFLCDEKDHSFDAVVISKVFTNEIIFNVSVKAIRKYFKLIAIASKLT
jgi:hypothetical protein